ncbi:penicillin-binding protein 1A [Nitrincola tapanii]|uniref:Penicillin-binding protein 1A n=1 Tax=Nitrincola tapanii TaxID=1708751 RepID=A0A5A9W6X4_9GAMM|nr:penicillin-binding protein 1A [Nitrincola tapanii]KAA0876263.1 penicillin-binding protein 1A [Nitrincola tapanii]
MRITLVLLKLVLGLFLLGLLTAVGAGAAAWFYFSPKLPNVQQLKEVRFQTPLRIYSADGKLIAEYGEQRRVPIRYEEIPEGMIQAILAAEDSRFYEHFGIDIKGLSRAALQLVSSGEIQTGGSTITMQVAKNFFLTRDRTFERKFNEILLSFIIERELTKQEIMELYVNKIYLGQRAYGVQAAAQVYYGKDIHELSIAQMAMIAGLPKAPSASNPVSNPRRSLERRNWILGRMHSLGYIDESTYQSALNEPEVARYHTSDIELSAFYVAEMVRQEMFRLYGENAYIDGYRVTTSIESRHQQASDEALRAALIAYNERHGYYGPEDRIEGQEHTLESLLAQLNRVPVFANMQPAVVTRTDERIAKALLRSGEEIEISWENMRWARRFINVNSMGPVPNRAAEIMSAGDIIRVYPTANNNWRLGQIPRVQGALVALDPHTGAIQALSGGFSFAHNNFNRATQAYRQPGSTLKPFLYAAALEQGYTAASIVNDSPIVIHDVSLQGEWRPENHSRDFEGPMRLREALYKSKNLVSIRLLRDLGVQQGQQAIINFGFEPNRTPANLSLALGASEATPLQLTSGYAVFANGGYRIDPYFILKVENDNEEVTLPEEAGLAFIEQNPSALMPKDEARRVISTETAFIINSILEDVIKRGTGRRALELNRQHLAGKTGTTNEQKDAWFSGYSQQSVATAWIGYDQPAPLGRSEYGGTAALPAWITLMRSGLEGQEDLAYPMPESIKTAMIDPASGQLAYNGQDNAIREFFTADTLPQTQAISPEVRRQGSVIDSLFD